MSTLGALLRSLAEQVRDTTSEDEAAPQAVVSAPFPTPLNRHHAATAPEQVQGAPSASRAPAPPSSKEDGEKEEDDGEVSREEENSDAAAPTPPPRPQPPSRRGNHTAAVRATAPAARAQAPHATASTAERSTPMQQALQYDGGARLRTRAARNDNIFAIRQFSQSEAIAIIQQEYCKLKELTKAAGRGEDGAASVDADDRVAASDRGWEIDRLRGPIGWCDKPTPGGTHLRCTAVWRQSGKLHSVVRETGYALDDLFGSAYYRDIKTTLDDFFAHFLEQPFDQKFEVLIPPGARTRAQALALVKGNTELGSRDEAAQCPLDAAACPRDLSGLGCDCLDTNPANIVFTSPSGKQCVQFALLNLIGLPLADVDSAQREFFTERTHVTIKELFKVMEQSPEGSPLRDWRFRRVPDSPIGKGAYLWTQMQESDTGLFIAVVSGVAIGKHAIAIDRMRNIVIDSDPGHSRPMRFMELSESAIAAYKHHLNIDITMDIMTVHEVFHRKVKSTGKRKTNQRQRLAKRKRKLEGGCL